MNCLACSIPSRWSISVGYNMTHVTQDYLVLPQCKGSCSPGLMGFTHPEGGPQSMKQKGAHSFEFSFLGQGEMVRCSLTAFCQRVM